MKIAVCLKRIPAPDGNIRLSADGRSFDFTLVDEVLNPPDEHALETALRVRSLDPSSRLVALSVGGRGNEMTLRMALAVGADEAWLVEAPGADACAAAALAAGALREFAPDLVFCGHQAVDDGQGYFPAALAEIFGIAHVTGVCAVEVGEDGRQMTCRRRVENGEQSVGVELPAVIACERMAHELRTPLLKARLESKKRPLTVLRPEMLNAELPARGSRSPSRVLALPPERKPRKVITAAPGWTASEFWNELRDAEGFNR